MIYIPGKESKEISLRVVTTVLDESEMLELGLTRLIEKLESGAVFTADELDELVDSECVEEIELLTVGRIRTNREGQVEIVYRENGDDPALKTLARIIFDPETPALVAMIKKGAINSSLSFEEEKTHICTYVTPYMPFKVYVTSSRVDNRLLEEGFLYLEYVLSIDDTAPRHFKVSVEINESEADPLKDFFQIC